MGTRRVASSKSSCWKRLLAADIFGPTRRVGVSQIGELAAMEKTLILGFCILFKDLKSLGWPLYQLPCPENHNFVYYPSRLSVWACGELGELVFGVLWKEFKDWRSLFWKEGFRFRNSLFVAVLLRYKVNTLCCYLLDLFVGCFSLIFRCMVKVKGSRGYYVRSDPFMTSLGIKLQALLSPKSHSCIKSFIKPFWALGFLSCMHGRKVGNFTW